MNVILMRDCMVNLPNIEPFIFVQTLVKLVRRVSLGQYTLLCFNKLHSVWVCHLTDDAINSIDGSYTPK